MVSTGADGNVCFWQWDTDSMKFRYVTGDADGLLLCCVLLDENTVTALASTHWLNYLKTLYKYLKALIMLFTNLFFCCPGKLIQFSVFSP